MSIETKVDICTGYITARQIDSLVDCGIATWADFTQRKQYDEFIFSGDKSDLFITDFSSLQELRCFTVTIGCDCIYIHN